MAMLPEARKIRVLRNVAIATTEKINARLETTTHFLLIRTRRYSRKMES